MYALRNRTAAAVPELGRHQFDTLRTRLLKVVVTVRQSVRRIWMQLPAAFPMAVAFQAVLAVGLSPEKTFAKAVLKENYLWAASAAIGRGASSLYLLNPPYQYNHASSRPHRKIVPKQPTTPLAAS